MNLYELIISLAFIALVAFAIKTVSDHNKQ